VSEEVSARLAVLQSKMVVAGVAEADPELAALMKGAATSLQRVRGARRELKGAQRASRKRVRELKKERTNEYSGGEEVRQRINKTFAELELNAKAAEMAEWCEECGAIHVPTLLSDNPVLPPAFRPGHAPTSGHTSAPAPGAEHGALLANLAAIMERLKLNQQG